ncbi:MAG: type I-C CRISPR-associated protein Cas8c/Csd1 [Hyphomicrobiales bacterium]|nr:type I-C CRISPR-associated protein Cas8c/Csd1 [Hyphomicrobiales bacterium]
MTILAALNGYYDRLAAQDDARPFGYSYEKISYALVLSASGEVVDVVPSLDTSGKKPRPQLLQVPRPAKRTSGVASNFLWDKTAYVLGVTEAATERTARERAAFRALHEDALAGTADEGLQALLSFLRSWRPERFDALPCASEMTDANVVFRLDGERGHLHDRAAARAIWAELLAAKDADEGLCLVTGESAPVARLHPAVKGVYGAQTAGASIVSFNLDAFTSYGKDQGANAPVSEHAAFGYTTALNRLLEKGHWSTDEKGRKRYVHENRAQIGDASTVFWAEAAEVGERAAEAAEQLFATLVDPPPPSDAEEAGKLHDVIVKIAAGRPLAEAAPDLQEETRFYVLGLAPNAARISVRFWHQDTLGALAARFREHWDDLRIEPLPWRTAPSLWRLLYETAAQGKAENIPPLLAGELMRAILGGGRYPRALLAAVIMRLRADRQINGRRAAILKACLARDVRLHVDTHDVRHGAKPEKVPVSLDRTQDNPGYRLGRLFAVLESIQRAALGRVNATIRDRYYGAASATPASVFPVLLRTAGHHIGNLRKGDKGGLAHWFEAEIGEIVGGLKAEFPRNLRIEDQGRFAIGYYHQRYAKTEDAPAEAEPLEQDEAESR